MREINKDDEKLLRDFINEYIHRYENFRGFFTKSNVTMLAAVTDKQ